MTASSPASDGSLGWLRDLWAQGWLKGLLLAAAVLFAYQPAWHAGFTVTESHLDMTAKIPGIDQAKFTAIANGAKAGCPISRLLKANITLDAKLEA